MNNEAGHVAPAGRTPRLVAGALLAGVLGTAGALVLSAGSAGADAASAAVQPAAVQVTVLPAHRPTPVVTPPETAVPQGRNPFEALYLPPEESGATDGATEVTDVTAATEVEAGTADGEDTIEPDVVEDGTTDEATVVETTPTTTPTTTTPTTSTTPVEAREAYPLTLVAISDPEPEVRRVSWKVDGEDVEVIPGQRFGRDGELVVLAFAQPKDGGAIEVLLQVGDETPKRFAIGETKDVL